MPVQKCHNCGCANIHSNICQDCPLNSSFLPPSSLHLLPPILHNYPEGCAPSSACSGPTVTPFSDQQWTGIDPVRSDYRQVWPGVNLLCPSLCQHAHSLPSLIAQTHQYSRPAAGRACLKLLQMCVPWEMGSVALVSRCLFQSIQEETMTGMGLFFICQALELMR